MSACIAADRCDAALTDVPEKVCTRDLYRRDRCKKSPGAKAPGLSVHELPLLFSVPFRRMTAVSDGKEIFYAIFTVVIVSLLVYLVFFIQFYFCASITWLIW